MRPELITLMSNAASTTVVLISVISGAKAARRTIDKTAEQSFRDDLIKDNAEKRADIERLEAKMAAQEKRIADLEKRNRILEEKNHILEGKLAALERNTE